jgi:hypothetical protein
MYSTSALGGKGFYHDLTPEALLGYIGALLMISPRDNPVEPLSAKSRPFVPVG